jgi:hypothetical protein
MPTDVIEVMIPRDRLQLYCPACGRPLLDLGEVEHPKCEHLVFTYLDLLQEFIYVAPAYKALAAAAKDAFDNQDQENQDDLNDQDYLDHLYAHDAQDAQDEQDEQDTRGDLDYQVRYVLERLGAATLVSTLCFSASTGLSGTLTAAIDFDPGGSEGIEEPTT